MARSRFRGLIWFAVAPRDEACCGSLGKALAHALLRGMPLAVADGLIAATAMEHDLIMVTRNVKDFVGTGVGYCLKMRWS
jgi:toxin FitB